MLVNYSRPLSIQVMHSRSRWRQELLLNVMASVYANQIALESTENHPTRVHFLSELPNKLYT